jgi:hypothetical protein
MTGATCSHCGHLTDSPDCVCCNTSIIERLRRGPGQRPLATAREGLAWAWAVLMTLIVVGLLIAGGR